METLESVIVFSPLRVEDEWLGAEGRMGEVLDRATWMD
jgi:hypothetical protein